MALHADVWRDPGDPADRSSGRSCPNRPPGQQKKRAGTLKRPSFAALFQPQFRRTTIVTTIMMACAYAAAFGADSADAADRPGAPEVRALAAHGAGADDQRRAVVSGVWRARRSYRSSAYLAAVIISRRRLLHVFQVPGLILMPIVFVLVPADGPHVGAVGHLPRRA